MNTERCTSFDPSRWNACIKLLCRSLDTLDDVQRPAALVFHYDGRVQNGGHSSHWDSPDADDDELFQALRVIGAHEQAKIFAEVRIIKRHNASDEIEELDRRYYRLRPSIHEVLARYFDSHRESFAK